MTENDCPRSAPERRSKNKLICQPTSAVNDGGIFVFLFYPSFTLGINIEYYIRIYIKI